MKTWYHENKLCLTQWASKFRSFYQIGLNEKGITFQTAILIKIILNIFQIFIWWNSSLQALLKDIFIFAKERKKTTKQGCQTHDAFFIKILNVKYDVRAGFVTSLPFYFLVIQITEWFPLISIHFAMKLQCNSLPFIIWRHDRWNHCI